MNCQQIDEHILAYCDETLSPELRTKIDEHLENCVRCQNLVRLTRLENSILEEGAGIPLLSADFTARVMSSVQSSQPNVEQVSAPAGNGSGLLSRLPRYLYAIGGTAAAAVLLLALYLPGSMINNNDIESPELADRSISSESSISELRVGSADDSGQNDLHITSTEMPADAASASGGGCSDDNSILPVQEEYFAAQEDSLPALRAASPDSSTASSQKSRSADDEQLLTLPLPDDSENELFKEELELDVAVDLLSLHPANLPPEYQIEKIINTSCKQVTYVYKDTETGYPLEITIGFAGLDICPEPIPDETTESEDLYSDFKIMNSVNTNISHLDHIFEINLKAPIPMEELQELANNIKFEEGSPDETLDE